MSNVKWLMSNDKGTPARFTDTDTKYGHKNCGAAVLRQFGSAVLRCCNAAVKAKRENKKRKKKS
jgi:hypothetical protein